MEVPGANTRLMSAVGPKETKRVPAVDDRFARPLRKFAHTGIKRKSSSDSFRKTIEFALDDSVYSALTYTS